LPEPIKITPNPVVQPVKIKTDEDKVSATQEHVQKAMERIHELSQHRLTNIQISVNKATGAFVIKVIDSNTGTIIREIPSEHVLNGLAQLLQQSGLCMDNKA
jgi:flagellar protein FlaG